MIILYLNSKLEQTITVKFLLEHKMFKKFYRIFSENNNYKLSDELKEELKKKHSNPLLEVLFMRDNARKELKSVVYSASSDKLHINYNNKYAAEVLNFGIRYGI